MAQTRLLHPSGAPTHLPRAPVPPFPLTQNLSPGIPRTLPEVTFEAESHDGYIRYGP